MGAIEEKASIGSCSTLFRLKNDAYMYNKLTKKANSYPMLCMRLAGEAWMLAVCWVRVLLWPLWKSLLWIAHVLNALLAASYVQSPNRDDTSVLPLNL